MANNIITRIRDIIEDGSITRAGLARAAGLHANTLRDCTRADWNPTAETLAKLERFLESGDIQPVLVPIEEIIEEARNGRMFILVDDEDRENEGDLVIPAQMATPQAVNFMATYGRGLICLSLDGKRCDMLGLKAMSAANGTRHETAFTVSIEAREGVTTGISAADRARTISVAIDGSKGAEDIVTPGHVFPLRARDGGVLVRAGHTEAAVDISRLAGLNPSGVICEIMLDNGEMARLDDLIPFARTHGLKIGTIRDLIEYRRKHDHLVECINEAPFESDYGGDWTVKSYRNKVDGSINLALQKGRPTPGEPTLVRMHTMSIYHDVLGQPGPRKRMLQRSMEAIGDAGSGVIVLLMPSSSDELAREIGRQPTRDHELRSYGIGAQILSDMGVHEMVLLTNTRQNVIAIEGYDLSIVDQQAIED
ncbi:MAG: 3,4-dihydroxy-2-butanone-4-phosphate synthase [Sphingomonadales bacterium]|nr:3,4-dihydroxy-2-butanone-4-phosphate synthase [Sphingomonadales bacterium]MBD3772143.1 3,4-dihydroxy-2-butanone-4-phosphate synthase [Paracoccaceae bacterium]